MTDWPKHKQKTKALKKFGDRREDPYYWLRARDSKPVFQFLHAENAYTDQKLRATRGLQKKLFYEFKARIKEDDVSAPYRRGAYFYYTRHKKGREYPIYCRRKPRDKEEIILDVNAIAKKHKYFDVAAVSVSFDQNWLLFAADTVGRRFYTIYFKNLLTGEILRENIPNTTGNAVWLNDNKTVLFGRQNPKTLRFDRIYRHEIGTQKKSELIYLERNEKFFVYVSKALTNSEVFIHSESSMTSEWRSAGAFDSRPHFKLFLKRQTRHEYALFDGGDDYFVLSNDRAKNFRLLQAPKDSPGRQRWREIVPHRKDVLIEDVLVLKNWIVLEERKNGLPRLSYFSRKPFARALPKPRLQSIQFPDSTYTVELGTNAEYDTDEIRYDYESLNRPETIYSFNLKNKRSTVLKITGVPTYDRRKYVSRRLWATSHDGTKVPISLVYKKNRVKTAGKGAKGQNPLFVYGYGSYGLNCDPYFRRAAISLLDRGFVFALAHVRGGSEMGRHWYEDGRLKKKRNTFLDFIAATQVLLRKGWGKPGHVYAMGGSAGGLLMGAVANMRPDLYNGMVAVVPFVDVLTTMLDDTLPLTTNEYEEWGNPNRRGDYKYMKSYSPYDNIRRQAYPHILITTGYHDSQVQYWEPAKWLAKLRDHTTRSDRLLLLKTELSAGHSGVTGRFESLKDIALEYAFVLYLEKLSQL